METQIKPTHRRYTEGRHTHYDFIYENELRKSEILNERFELPLDEYLVMRRQRLEILEVDLQDHIATMRHTEKTQDNKGGLAYRPDPRFTEKKLAIQARIDVTKTELQVLERLIEEEEQEREEAEILPCLPNGPIGINQIRGDSGTGFFDGQYCEPIQGIIVITDQRSPYRGLKTTDYILHVSRPWRRACKEHTANLRKKYLAEGDIKSFENVLPRSSRLAVPYPAFPKQCKKHLK